MLYSSHIVCNDDDVIDDVDDDDDDAVDDAVDDIVYFYS
jgi:hypothetical protein